MLSTELYGSAVYIVLLVNPKQAGGGRRLAPRPVVFLSKHSYFWHREILWLLTKDFLFEFFFIYRVG